MSEFSLEDLRERLRESVITEGRVSPGELIDTVGTIIATLKMGLEIHDEYLSQIANCVSQDYARLNDFAVQCRHLGIQIKDGKAISE